ncbi:MAG: hypothetical protein WB384_23280, partial [Candidatus Sulfotelmatobacter sp.]
GGTNAISATSVIGLNLGYSNGGSGTYSLSGSGLLSAPNEYMGVVSYMGVSGTGTFTLKWPWLSRPENANS